MKVLVTGANGFVGSALVTQLLQSRNTVLGAVRSRESELPPNAERVVMGDITPNTDWRGAVAGVNVVIHLASRVHVLRDTARQPSSEFRRINVDATRSLARQAVEAGVTRFVFISSLKVNGDTGTFRESDTPAPRDPYGISKHEAESALAEIGSQTGMEIVVVRPPLVYGPGVKANFRALMLAVARGIPLPFGAVDNRRSLIGLDNLVDAIIRCGEHPAAANETFLVSDGMDLSTPDLIRMLAAAMRRKARLIPVPVSLMRGAAQILNRGDVAQRLLGSLQVDITKARRVLDWTPPVTVDEGLRRAVRDLQ